MNRIEKVYHSDRSTWVGDGFPTNSMLPLHTISNATSPFLVMGYTSQYPFAPISHQRGVGLHPHRGFETVTIVYEGELEHRDSKGNHGIIGPDEVQWMTAGKGILHEEHHSQSFAASGGTLEMIQLWVNLPRVDKLTNPRYQELTKQNIPQIDLNDQQGSIRIIAGEYQHGTQNIKGPAKTFSAMNVYDLRLNKDGEQNFLFNPRWNTMIFVLSGEIEIDQIRYQPMQTLYVSKHVSDLKLRALSASKLLILSGEPLNEPIVAHGPFVMNSEDEISQAFIDFQNGQFAV